MEPGGEDPGPQLEGGWAGQDTAAPEMRGGTSAFSPGSSPSVPGDKQTTNDKNKEVCTSIGT